jgi:hypothetical protein
VVVGHRFVGGCQYTVCCTTSSWTYGRLGLCALSSALDAVSCVTLPCTIEFEHPRSCAQAQALSWVRSANLEVAMWASCSVVEACLVRPPRLSDAS